MSVTSSLTGDRENQKTDETRDLARGGQGGGSLKKGKERKKMPRCQSTKHPERRADK